MKKLICLAVLFALLLSVLPASSAVPGPGSNSITLTAVDTSKKGQGTASGTFTTAKVVTLTKVRVFALPVLGGQVATPGMATTIDHTKGTWGGATITGLYFTNYTFRAEGTFSDGTVYSSNVIQKSVLSDAFVPAGQPSLQWTLNSPSSPQAGRISGSGLYVPATDGSGTTFNQNTAAGTMQVYPSSGGAVTPALRSPLTFDSPAAGFWSAANIDNLTSGTTYNIYVIANASDGKTYCAPFASIPAQ